MASDAAEVFRTRMLYLQGSTLDSNGGAGAVLHRPWQLDSTEASSTRVHLPEITFQSHQAIRWFASLRRVSGC